MRGLFALFFMCLISGVAYGTAPWREVNARSSQSTDKSVFWLNNGNSYECNPVYRKQTFSFESGKVLQTLYGTRYKCVEGWPDTWEKMDPNWCENTQLQSLDEKGVKYCVFMKGESQRCRVVGGDWVEDGAWPDGCLYAECDGQNVWDEETKKCVPKENNDAVVDERAAETQQSGQVVESESGPRVGDDCAADDFPQFATAGKYIKSGNSVKCAATSCNAGTYLVVKNGASQGWCVAGTYCKNNTRLNIIDETKTDLQCVQNAEAPVEEESETEEPTVEVVDEPVNAGGDEGGDNNSGAESENVDNQNNSETVIPQSGAGGLDEPGAGNEGGSPEAAPVADNSNDTTPKGPKNTPLPSDESKLSQEDSEAKIAELKDNAQKMKDKEQSTENKLLGAVGMGATGIGLMQTMSASAEQSADEEAERDMAAYLATMHCNYGGGKNIAGGETAVELPGGNDLMALVAEYKALAADLKIRKTALDMRPGIESEVILDKSDPGLYDDIALGKTDGAYTSLARALSDETSADAAEWAQQKADTADKKKTGLIVAGVGAVGSLAGNLAINSGKNKQDKTDEILAKYEPLKKAQIVESVVLNNSVSSVQPVAEADVAPQGNGNAQGDNLISGVLNGAMGGVNLGNTNLGGTGAESVVALSGQDDVVAPLIEENGSQSETKIIALSEMIDDRNQLTQKGKTAIDDMMAQVKGRACFFEIVMQIQDYDVDRDFDTVRKKLKSIEEYLRPKIQGSSVQVDPLVHNINTSACKNENPGCPNVKLILQCIAEQDVLTSAGGGTRWETLDANNILDTSYNNYGALIYQTATRGEYKDYLNKAKSACETNKGKWKEDVLVFTMIKNKSGKYNTYQTAICDFGTPDNTSGSTRCYNMCKKANVRCTQSGGFGYDNYTACFFYPPSN